MSAYTAAVGLAVLAAVLIVLVRTPAALRGRMGDVLLAGMVFGLLGGRAVHVALHWYYFADYLPEIVQLRAGGLDWHGVVIGSLAGMALTARWRHLSLAGAGSSLVWAVPLIAIGAWVGCGAAACAYGREVSTLSDYPAWLVSDAPDIYGLSAPRFNTPLLGMIGMTVLLLVVGGLHGRVRGRRLLGIALMLLGSIMLLLGYMRGDDVLILLELRADQWLDGVIILTGTAFVFYPARHNPTATFGK